MEIEKALLYRRSIRRYTPERIEPEIITELIKVRLQIDFLHEFDYSQCQLLSYLKQSEDGLWRYDDLPGGLRRPAERSCPGH